MPDAREGCETPLVELLRSIPPDARLQWQDDTGLQAHHVSPVGKHCHEAADTIASLLRREEMLREALGSVLQIIDESYRTYCFEWLAEDVRTFQNARQALEDTDNA